MSVLTEAQRNSYMEAMKANRDKLMELRMQVNSMQREIFEATLTNKWDENLIREKAMAQARIEAEMTVLNAKAFSEIQPPLTTEQIEKLKAPPAPAPVIRPMPAQPPPAAGNNQPAPGSPPK